MTLRELVATAWADLTDGDFAAGERAREWVDAPFPSIGDQLYEFSGAGLRERRLADMRANRDAVVAMGGEVA